MYAIFLIVITNHLLEKSYSVLRVTYLPSISPRTDRPIVVIGDVEHTNAIRPKATSAFWATKTS